jgi:serine/threonine protein kinase
VEQTEIDTLSKSRGATATIGHFELIEEVGRGAFGTVWRARDAELDRQVAVKIPRDHQTSSEDREQFLREARAVAQINHANIVSVHEVGRDGEQLYIVSDFVKGVTLAEKLTAERLENQLRLDLPWQQNEKIDEQLPTALQAVSDYEPEEFREIMRGLGKLLGK